MRRWLSPFAGVLLASLVVAGCGSDSGSNDRATVFAAASLTDAFKEIGDAFHAAHPDADVEFNFAGSPALVTQIDQGAPADVLATADTTNMQHAADMGLIADEAQTFARNRLAIIVPSDNPAGIETYLDIANDGVKLVLAQEGVPAGDYARQVLDNIAATSEGGPGFAARTLSNVVSEESNVKAVVTKVQLGEVDAGIAYFTDVTPDLAADITLIEIPDGVNVIGVYPIAATRDASRPELARAFIEFVLSDEGQAILERSGFMRSPE